MGKDYCMHGCYPVDRKWHGGDLKIEEDEIGEFTDVSSPEELKNKLGEEVYDGKGAFEISDIFDLRRFVDEFGPEAAENLMRAKLPAGEPYMRGDVDSDSESIEDKIKKRGISLSTIGQGPEMGAYLEVVDVITTHYKYDTAIKTTDAMWATPESQVHQELVQRRQQAEQQINRTLGNLSDLYEQKQLLEHDLRQLEARLEHVKNAEKAGEIDAGGKKKKGEEEVERDTQDELKADFVDLVDQHTGRHSILQMQANNVFPSITADFYSMTSLEDLEPGGHLENLPENEKAVLRKKWKLYLQWKEQFQSAVKSRYNDIKRRLNSVETSIEQTENWIKPYVQDIKMITQDFDVQLETWHGISKYLPVGYANVYRSMKVIANKDQSPANEDDLYYDVVVMDMMQGAMPDTANPQAAGQGLSLFYITFYEYLVCKHVYEAVFEKQQNQKKNEVKEYIKKYLGENGPVYSREEIEAKREEVLDKLGDGKIGKGAGKTKLMKGRENLRERVESAETMDELEKLEHIIEYRKYKPSFLGRKRNDVLKFFGATDEFYYENPENLRRNLIGPGFPTQFYLDYKYSSDMFVMK